MIHQNGEAEKPICSRIIRKKLFLNTLRIRHVRTAVSRLKPLRLSAGETEKEGGTP